MALETRESLIFASWLVTSLLAVAGALLNGWLGFALALAGGVVTGILCLRARTNIPAPTSSAASSPLASPQASEQPLASFHSAATSSLASAVVATIRPPETPSAIVRRRGFLYRWASALDRYELLMLAAASPFFIFPQASFVWIGLLIPALWLNRLYVRGYVSVRSPLNLPLLLLLLMLGPSFLIAADHELALSKVTGVLLGVGLYFAVLNLRSSTVTDDAIPAIGVLAIGIAVVGFVGTDWPVSGKLPLYGDIYQVLPKLLHTVPRSTTGGGINPNETGGTMTWLLPFLTAAWLQRPTDSVIRRWIENVMLIIAIVMCSVLLLLSQSRGAIFAVLGGILFLTALHARLLPRLLVGAAILALIVLVVRVGHTGVDDIVGLGGGSATGGLPQTLGSSILDRVAVWQSAAELIHRYPVGGVGLTMFSIVARQQVDPEMPQQTTHAHNLLIQSAMDFGLPGLTAYAAMLICAYGLLFLVIRAQPRSSGNYALALALAGGLVANQLFGLTDAIAFGQKPGFVFWIFLGLTAYLWNEAQSRSEGMVANAYNPSPIAD